MIFGIELYKADTGSDWSAAFKHLTYFVNGNIVGFSFNTIGAYLIVGLGALSQFLKLNRKKG